MTILIGYVSIGDNFRGENMKKVIYTTLNEDFVKCSEVYGDGSIGLVREKEFIVSLYDKDNHVYLTPKVQGKAIAKDNIVVIVGEKRIYIYNFIEKRFIVNGLDLVWSDYSNIFAFANKDDGIYYLVSIDENKYLTFDNITIKTHGGKKPLLIVTDQKGKGIYREQYGKLICHAPTGTIKGVEVCSDDYYLATTTTNKRRYIDCFNGKISKEYDQIKNYYDYLVCQNTDMATFIDDGKDRAFINIKCEELEYSTNLHDASYFIVKRNGKYGIITYNYKYSWGKIYYETQEESVLPCAYDKIEFDSSSKSFFLYKDDKIGLYSPYYYKRNKVVEPDYKSIQQLEECIFLFENLYGKKKIVDIRTMFIIVDDVDSVDDQRASKYDTYKSANIIYTKDGTKGCINPYSGKVVEDHLDEINYICSAFSSRYYKTRCGQNDGLIIDDKITLQVKEGQNIITFKNCPLFVVYDEKGTHICRYQRGEYEEIFTFEIKRKVDFLGYSEDGYDKNVIPIFKVDEEFYKYDNSGFENCTIYHATYELDDGSVYTNVTSSRIEHEEYIAKMDNMLNPEKKQIRTRKIKTPPN